MLELRDYQRASLDALDAAWARGGPGDGQGDGRGDGRGDASADGDAPGRLVVLPTGAGKSVVIAALARRALAADPRARVAVVTHSRELVAQNARALARHWPEAPMGVFSAGLRRREAGAQVLVCGIQSVADRVGLIGPRDLVVVDEAHLIPRSADTRYGRFLAGLRALRPGMRVAGFTATPYRLDTGRLDAGPGRLFSGIAYEAAIGDLIARGHLAPLVSKATVTRLDVAGVGRRGGDYIPGELEAAVNRDAVTRAAVAEMVAFGEGRRAWLAFCAGVAHAEAVRDAVRAEGVSCEAITGETGARARDRIVAAFRAGGIRCLTSVDVLGTGFDVPGVDLVALLRPTQSTGLYVQQVGRALRNAPGKQDALVLDYAGLVALHGPVDAVSAVSAEAVRGGAGGLRAKPCPGCGALIALNASTCEACWTEPETEPAALHAAEAEDALPILSDEGLFDGGLFDGAAPRRDPAPTGDAPDWRPVTGFAIEAAADGLGAGLDVRLAWTDGAGEARTWAVRLRPEGRGYEREKAVLWWRGLGGGRDAPVTAAEFLGQADALAPPAAVSLRRGRLTEELACRAAGGRVLTDVRREHLDAPRSTPRPALRDGARESR